MSLFTDSSLRASLREVIEWEKKHPDIVARDAAADERRAAKAKADIVRLASMPTTHAPKTKRAKSAKQKENP